MNQLTRAATASLTALATAALTAVFICHWGADHIETALVDYLFKHRGQITPPGNTVIVKVDRKTYLDLDEDPTELLPRKYYAKLLQVLARAGALGAAFDISIKDPERRPDPDVSGALTQSMRELPVILPLSEKEGHGPEGRAAALSSESLRQAAYAEGVIDITPDLNIIRRFPAVRGAPLSLAAARLKKEITQLPYVSDYINYYGGPNTIESYSLSETLKNQNLPATFHDKIVFVGYTISVPSIKLPIDTFATPLGRLHGVEIQATMTENLISGKWIKRFTLRQENYLIFGLVFAVALTLLLTPPKIAALFWLISTALAATAVAHMFEHGLYLPGFISASCVLLLVLGIRVLWSYLASERLRAKLALEAAKRETELASAAEKRYQAMCKVLPPRLAQRAAENPSILDAPEEGEEVEAAMKRGLGLDKKHLAASKGSLEPGFIVAESYVIERALGEGASGTVYLARERLTGEQYALKVLKNDCPEPELRREFAGRFLREIRLSGAVDSPHVVKRFDFGVDGEILYFTMEYIDGGTLADIAGDKALAINDAINYVLQISKGLGAIHEKDIIHRDLKAANVMIKSGGNGKIAKITDFGLARPLQSTLTIDGYLMGTPAHLAPELWDFSPATQRSDIYALGVLFYNLVTGKYPFEGENLASKHKHHAPRAPRFVDPKIPPWVNDLIIKMLDKDPLKRPGSAKQVIDEINQSLKGETLPGWEEEKAL